MILDIYKDSFEYSSKRISVLLVMGVLSFFGLLIVPYIFVRGYDYKVIKSSLDSMINSEDQPPEFNGFKSLFVDGIKVIVLNIVYLIIPFIFFVIATRMPNLSTKFIVFVIFLIILIISLMCAYIATPHMAFNDSLKSAFDIKEIFKIIKSIGLARYFLSYIGVFLISAVFLIVAFALMMVIFTFLNVAIYSVSYQHFSFVSIVATIAINFVLGFIITPYLSLFQDRCSALIYNMR